MEQVLLSEIIPREILQEIQDAYARFTGMASLISDANGTPVTKGSNFTRFCMELTRKSECGGKNCQECGRKGALSALGSGKPAVYRCHAGLMDYAAPIMLNGNFIGSFTGGQIRTAEVDEEFFRQKAIEYDIDPDTYVEAAKETNMLQLEAIEKAAQFLSEIAGALSMLAYERFQLMEKKQRMEKMAMTRKDLLKKCSNGLSIDIKALTEFLIRVSDNSVDGLDEEDREFSRQMADNMMIHAAELDNTLNFMEKEIHDMKLDETVYDVRWIVQRQVESLRRRVAAKRNTIEYEVASNVPRLMAGDPGRISSIVGQCIRNSIRYTDEGRITIRLSAQKAGYATILIIRVEDEGGGMSKEDAQRILQYIRGRSQSDTWIERMEMEGMAMIGYSLSALSATIDMESEIGKGTTMIFKIPQLAV